MYTLHVTTTRRAATSLTSNVEMERVSRDFYTPVYDADTIESLANEFSRLADEHYLDHAGATLHSETQIKRVSNDMLTSLYANPHSAGAAGNLTHEIIERVRHRLLDHFHASPEEYDLVFTSGATAALKSVAETFQFSETETSGRAVGSFVYLQDNHTSVLGMRDSVARRGARVSCLSHRRAFDVFAKRTKAKNTRATDNSANSLFVYSAQCNFNGFKYPLKWIGKVHEGILDATSDESTGNWYVLLDAAGYVGTNELDLSAFGPDFVVLSFYKMFGYPTGAGALLVKKSSSHVLQKVYYGGGTVNLALSLRNFHVKRDVFHERFEDGTLPFLSIVSLQHGLDAMSVVSLDDISKHVFSLARYFHHSLKILRHRNERPVARVYSDSDYEDPSVQGGIVTFNLLRSNGEYVGFNEVVHMAALFRIHLRTGCFCNPGTCQRQLGLSDRDVMDNYEAGYTCGGSRDLINGRPTGACRISFGYMSTPENVDALLLMIKKCFLDAPEVDGLALRSIRSSSATRLDNGQAQVHQTVQVVAHDDLFTNGNGAEPDKFGENGVSHIGDEISRGSKDYGVSRLSRLFVYPVKSCAAYEVDDCWLLGERGLQYDREWMIVTSAGICLSQKQQVKLCLLKPTICRDENILILDYPGMPPAQVPLEITSQFTTNGELCRSRVCGHRVEGIDCGADVSEWLSLALGQPNLRLIRQNNTKDFGKDSSKPELSFSSQAQYLLINEASVQWIASKLPESSDCSRKTILHRFRGNMVLRGSSPFRETTWSEIRIGNHEFQVNGPCTRCQMVCIDQTTGKKTVEPLRLLAEEFHGKMRFGVYLSRKKGKPALISIGDPIVTE